MTVTGGSGAPSYELDIRAPSGFQNRLTGLQPDAGQQLDLPESALSPGETNALRLRAEGDPGTGYSIPVSLLYDPSVTSSSSNQIRSLGVSRSGTDLVLRWSLLSENGKQTKLSFRRADTGTTYLLTPTALASSVKTLTLSSQALASPCGDFLLTQVLQTSETGATPPLRNPSGESGTQGTEVNPCDDPPPGSPPSGPSFVNAYHHRDHLGTLRDVTDDGGYLVAGFDWYPYGTRMATGATTAPEDSRRLFTGHERDLATGLDYMLARYYSAGLARFLSTDPALTLRKNLRNPQRWNRYAYVLNNPLKFMDPNGEDPFLCARPLRGDPDSKFSHMFVVTGASKVGDQSAGVSVKSWGMKDNGNMGRVDDKTTNKQSKGTNATDAKAWQSAGQPGSATVCTPIPASDQKVEQSTSAVMENKDYSAIAGPFGVNSNSAAQAVANDAAGQEVETPGDRLAPGVGSADDVDLDHDGDGKADPKKEEKKEPLNRGSIQ